MTSLILKAQGEKYNKDFLRLNNSKIAVRDENCTKELITNTNFKVLNLTRIKESDVSNKL